jgi:DNA-binding MarR family transcriptional regulator
MDAAMSDGGEDLLDSPIERLTRAMFTKIIANLSATLAAEDFSVAQVAALYLLDERGTLRVGELATELGRSQPSTSRLVDSLVQKKLVVRKQDAEDRRARTVQLAAKGRAMVERASIERVRTMLRAARLLPITQVASMFESLRNTS